MLAVSKDIGAEAVPGRCRRPVLKAREGCHPEIEPAIPLRLAPQHQLDEEEVDDATRRFWEVAHEVDGNLMLSPTLPAVRSEEHTSDIQSLMRYSYDVLCL